MIQVGIHLGCPLDKVENLENSSCAKDATNRRRRRERERGERGDGNGGDENDKTQRLINGDDESPIVVTRLPPIVVKHGG